MKSAGFNPYDQDIAVDITISFDIIGLLDNVKIGSMISKFSNVAQGVKEQFLLPEKPGTKAKEKAIGRAAPIRSMKVVDDTTTDNQGVNKDTLVPKEKE